MKRALQVALLTIVVLAAGVGGFLLSAQQRNATVDATRLLDMQLPDLSGVQRRIASWQGKVLVINFWATWCPPCLEEIPHFVRLQAELGDRGLQFIGIAIDERDKVQAFAARYQMNYPVMIGQLDAVELTRTAGNAAGALPYTLILDRAGRVVSQHYGGLTEQFLRPTLSELL